MDADTLDLIVPNRNAPIHERLAELHRRFKKPIFTTAAGMLINGQSKYVTHRFSESFVEKYRKIEILHLTDVQFGHHLCMVDKFVEYRDWVLAQPYRFVTFGGDLLDAWRMGSPGEGYDNFCRPDSQFYYFCEIVAPMQHRILGHVGGNHERRALAGGIDLGGLLSYALQIPYSAGIQHIGLRYGDWQNFKIYLWHGRGASRTEGAIVNMMTSVVSNDEADIYLSGHLHRTLMSTGVHNRRTGDRMEARKYYCVSGTSFLEFYGSYAEIAGFKVSKLIMPLIIVRADGTFRVEI